MSERPILFSGAMVRAILAGTKTQTRRVVDVARAQKKGVLGADGWRPFDLDRDDDRSLVASNCGRVCPYGAVGDRLWVRETHAITSAGEVLYRARGDRWAYGWKPSIFMRREHSRLTLDVVNVRVERLQDISEGDAGAEGLRGPLIDRELDRIVSQIGVTPRAAYSALWDSINGDRAPWASNPYVWVVTFKRADAAAEAA